MRLCGGFELITLHQSVRNRRESEVYRKHGGVAPEARRQAEGESSPDASPPKRTARTQDDQGFPQTVAKLDRAADAEFPDAGLQRGALHTEQGGGAAGTGDAPLGLPKRTENVLALGFFQRCHWSRW